MTDPLVQHNLSEELRECVMHLSRLCGGMEPEFLRLGRDLESFYERARDLSERAKEAVQVGEGRTLLRLFGDVKGISERSLDVLASTIEESTKAIGHVAAIGGRLKDIRRRNRSLEKLAFVTKMLGLSSRIESQHLGDLGEEFTFVSNQVSSFSRTLSGYAASFDSEIEQALSGIGRVETSLSARLADQRAEYQRTAGQIGSVLDAVSRASAEMTALSGEIEEFSAGMSREVGEIVAALQFQDIVRQQLEHVQEALAEISDALEQADGGVEELRAAYATLAVQVSQLGNVKERIAGAGRDIVSALKGMEGRIRSHADYVSGAVGGGGDGRQGASGMLKPLIEAVGAQLMKSFSLTEELSTSVQNVTGLVERIGSNRKRIDEVCMDMKILAINAMVQASPLGDKGLKLMVIADDMKRLADSWGVTAERMINGLQEGVDLATRLETELVNVLEQSWGETARNQEEASGAVMLLQTADRKVKESVLGINEVSREFGEDIGEAVGGIRFPEIADAALGEVVERLKAVQAKIRRSVPDGGERLVDTPFMESAARRYTMESERIVHRSTLGECGRDSSGVDDDLGDNVELF